jgi:hypothetical protein
MTQSFALDSLRKKRLKANMKGNIWILGALLLIIVQTKALCAQVKSMPEIWNQIEKEAKSIIIRDPRGENYQAWQKQLDEVAHKIADNCDRSSLESMVLGVDDLLDSNPNGQLLRLLSIRVLVNVADPKNEHGLQELGSRDADAISWYGVATTAIDSYHDTCSCDLLLELASKSGKQKWIQNA